MFLILAQSLEDRSQVQLLGTAKGESFKTELSARRQITKLEKIYLGTFFLTIPIEKCPKLTPMESTIGQTDGTQQ